MPASRRARAMTFAPRSWPSRPGLATSTRILRSGDMIDHPSALVYANAYLTMRHILWHIIHMASINIRQLRDTRRLKAWLQAGKTVELRERNRILGHIVPDGAPTQPPKWPDFAARAKKTL